MNYIPFSPSSIHTHIHKHTHTVLGRFIIPIGLCLYFAVNRKRMAREEAKRVREALDKEQKKKEAYVEEMYV